MKNWIAFLALLTYQTTYSQFFDNDIIFLQGNVSRSVSSEKESIQLQKKSFKIRFQSKFYNESKEDLHGLKVIVFSDDNNFKIIEEGMPIGLIPNFENGNMLPMNKNGYYTSAVVDEFMHHFLFYENDYKRNVSLVSKKNGSGIFEWEINKLFINGNDFDLQDIKNDALTFILLNDFNANKVIDTNELRIVKIHFN